MRIAFDRPEIRNAFRPSTVDELYRALDHAAACEIVGWLEGRYADGIVRVLARLDGILRKRSRQARRDPEHFERKVVLPAKLGDLVHGIRRGHRPATGELETTEVSR